MKLFTFFFLSCALLRGLSMTAHAQWLSSSGSQSVYLSTTTYPYSIGVGAGPNNTQSILAKFHVANEALFTSASGFTTGPNLGAGNLSIAGAVSGLNLWKRSLTSLSDTTTAGNRFLWYNDGAARLRTGTTGDLISVLSSGNVGIGWASPAYKLHINGDLKVKNNVYFNNAFNLVDSATGNFGFKSSTTSGLQFFTKISTARMSIDTNGHVSVGGGNVNLTGAGNLTLASGKIGVGKSNPTTPVDVASSTSGAIRLLSGADTLSTSFAIGRSVAEAYLGMAGTNGNLSTQTTPGDLVLQNYVQDIIIAARNSIGAIRFTTGWNNDTARVTIAHNGNVGIGTTNPDTFKLAVNGIIKAKEIVVDTAGWADYVFSDGYELKSLEEVESTIKRERHLPGIPSAAEIGSKGIYISEMQAKLLEKIEELTLYVIQLKRDNEQLGNRIDAIGMESMSRPRK